METAYSVRGIDWPLGRLLRLRGLGRPGDANARASHKFIGSFRWLTQVRVTIGDDDRPDYGDNADEVVDGRRRATTL
jgi:hypothetical protein